MFCLSEKNKVKDIKIMNSKLLLFLLICYLYPKIGLTQLALKTTIEAHTADLDFNLLHDRNKVKELITSSYFDTKKGTTHIEINTYFDSLGRNVKIAYFVKGDSTPYNSRFADIKL
jgi:hypothetical protein